MKSKLNRLKAFLRNNIWAHFIFNFIFFLIFTYFLRNVIGTSTRSLNVIAREAFFFSLFMTPFLRYLGKEENGFDPYEKVDNVRHYKMGQRPQLKTYLESKGYKSDYNNGSISYFKNDNKSILSNQQTFLHESDHWIALVAAPPILAEVPSYIESIYPKS